MIRAVQLKKLRAISKYVLRCEGQSRASSVEIIFVGPARMRELNKKYRGKDRVTDVLSFEAHEENYWGEIFLCRSYLRAQAREVGVAYDAEVARMTIHGTLHLLGYDHMKLRDEKIMFGLQEKYLAHFV